MSVEDYRTWLRFLKGKLVVYTTTFAYFPVSAREGVADPRDYGNYNCLPAIVLLSLAIPKSSFAVYMSHVSSSTII